MINNQNLSLAPAIMPSDFMVGRPLLIPPMAQTYVRVAAKSSEGEFGTCVTGSVTDMPWKRVKVGSILKVFDDEDFPADLLCLYCSLADSICYIKTTNLDGGVRLQTLVHHP